MHVIVVCQNKGGDGKTTLSRLLGEWAGRHGVRTLMIDMDPQCNLSKRLIAMDHVSADPDGVLPPVHPEWDPEDEWDGRSSIADIYNKRVELYGLTPYKTNVENVDILPGHGSSMRAVELVRNDEVRERVVERLWEFIRQPEFQGLYDLIVVDTPPSKGPLVLSAIRAATHMIIPSQMEPNSVDGLHGMLQQWRRENENRPLDRQLKMLGILPNKVRNVSLHTDTLAGLRTRTPLNRYLLPFLINQRTAFAETDHPNAAPQSVFDLKEENKAREEAEVVCRYVLEQLGLAAAERTEPDEVVA